MLVSASCDDVAFCTVPTSVNTGLVVREQGLAQNGNGREVLGVHASPMERGIVI